MVGVAAGEVDDVGVCDRRHERFVVGVFGLQYHQLAGLPAEGGEVRDAVVGGFGRAGDGGGRDYDDPGRVPHFRGMTAGRPHYFAVHLLATHPELVAAYQRNGAGHGLPPVDTG